VNWSLQLDIILETTAAMILGALIGIEREIADKPAGLRTHMLVAGSAALLVSLSGVLIEDFGSYTSVDLIRSDPIRIIQAIIIGISFLGAGTIIRRERGTEIEGLTTAAALLLSGGIGVSVALKQYVVAVGVTLLGLIILNGLRTVERRMKQSRRTGG